jgi:hypothetical protein
VKSVKSFSTGWRLDPGSRTRTGAMARDEFGVRAASVAVVEETGCLATLPGQDSGATWHPSFVGQNAPR